MLTAEDFVKDDNSEKYDVEKQEEFDFLGPMNTVADFVAELYDSLFRDILGNSVMDRTLGSFSKQELFRVMSVVFLQDGNGQLYKKLIEAKGFEVGAQ